MDNVSFVESEMTFGEYDEDSFLRIEECIQYTERLKNNGVKICEFLLLKGKKLVFVEAKKSCPCKELFETCESKSQGRTYHHSVLVRNFLRPVRVKERNMINILMI